MADTILAAISGGLGVLVLGLLGTMRRNGNGGGRLEAKVDEALLVLREMATILNERLPRR